jgi:hypothetical protein
VTAKACGPEEVIRKLLKKECRTQMLWEVGSGLDWECDPKTLGFLLSSSESGITAQVNELSSL